MMELWQIVSHVGITLAAVIGLALRIEHRLTKIETDVGWLKNEQASKEKGCCDNESSVDVD